MNQELKNETFLHLIDELIRVHHEKILYAFVSVEFAGTTIIVSVKKKQADLLKQQMADFIHDTPVKWAVSTEHMTPAEAKHCFGILKGGSHIIVKTVQ